MMNLVLRAGIAVILYLAPGMAAFADPIPEGYRAENIEVIGYVDAAGELAAVADANAMITY